MGVVPDRRRVIRVESFSCLSLALGVLGAKGYPGLDETSSTS